MLFFLNGIRKHDAWAQDTTRTDLVNVQPGSARVRTPHKESPWPTGDDNKWVNTSPTLRCFLAPLRVLVGSIPAAYVHDIVYNWVTAEADSPHPQLFSFPVTLPFPRCVTLLLTIKNICVISCEPIKQVLCFTPKVAAIPQAEVWNRKWLLNIS